MKILTKIADKVEDAMIEFVYAFPNFSLHVSVISLLIAILALYIKWSK